VGDSGRFLGLARRVLTGPEPDGDTPVVQAGDLGLGNGVNFQIASPTWTPVTGLASGVVQVSGGSEESLALTSDGSVWAWSGTNLGSGANGLSDVFLPRPAEAAAGAGAGAAR
jgi:hypothetical protein